MAETPEEKFNSPVSESLKQIRTFQGDIAQALTNQNESLFSIQQQESLKRGSVPQEFDRVALAKFKQRRQFIWFFLGGLILISLGSGGAWLTYNEFLRRSASPTVAIPESRFILPNTSTEFDITDLDRSSLITKIFEAEALQGDLKHIVLNPSIQTAEFLQILQTQPPGNLVRALDPIFMLGYEGHNPFIIFKISSYENAFAGMLNWEKNLATDLGPLFIRSVELNVIGTESVFKDIISRNKDVRALFAGTSTEPVLLYSFFNNKMIILSNNLETLRIVVDKLTQELLSR